MREIDRMSTQAFTGIALAGPAVFFGYAFAIGAGVALMGIAMSVLSLQNGRHAPKGTKRRRTAIWLGSVGIVMCSSAIFTLLALWLWLPGEVAYTPLWSAQRY